jgi:hypothetical protein
MTALSICYVFCKKCNHVKARGYSEFITIGGKRYISSNPLVTCVKCNGQIKTVWNHQEGFDQVKKLYAAQNPFANARKAKHVNKEPKL